MKIIEWNWHIIWYILEIETSWNIRLLISVGSIKNSKGYCAKAPFRQQYIWLFKKQWGFNYSHTKISIPGVKIPNFAHPSPEWGGKTRKFEGVNSWLSPLPQKFWYSMTDVQNDLRQKNAKQSHCEWSTDGLMPFKEKYSNYFRPSYIIIIIISSFLQ